MTKLAYTILCFCVVAALGSLIFGLLLLWQCYGLPRLNLWRAERERARRDFLARKYGLVPFYSKKDRIIRQDAVDEARITGRFQSSDRSGDTHGVIR